MAYEFGRIELRIFDFHLSLAPLLEANQVKAPMSFLTDADAYRRQFQAPPFICGQFRVRPLRKKSWTYHHFWKYYANAYGQLDPWLLLMPFVCEPTPAKLSVESPGRGIRAFARPATYLFPFGWSNTIEMSLQGKMSPATLQEYVGKIRRSNDSPFQMQGKNVGLSGVFRQYSDQLKQACFVKGAGALDYRKVDRHVIVSITQFQGDVAFYKPWGRAGPTMPVSDKAALHSVLLGETVENAQVAAADAGANVGKDFLLTRYHDAGFAVSYFDKGTLIFLQDAAGSSQNTEVLRCLTSNILLCMMMMRGLLNFHLWPETQSAAPQSVLGQMRDVAKRQLLGIDDRYRNPLCKTWFKYYEPLKKLKEPEEEGR